jgi:hypothetical protein
MQPARGVSRYISDKQQKFHTELNFYARERDFKKAIRIAARSERCNKREHHQCRIPASVLRSAGDRLCQHWRSLKRFRSFEALHNEVRRLLLSPDHKIGGVGPLTAYDIALRIGARLDMKPRLVHLHAGARVGAKRVRVARWRADTIERKELPAAFMKLSPAECENCLCIYFTNTQRRGSSSHRNQPKC